MDPALIFITSFILGLVVGVVGVAALSDDS